MLVIGLDELTTLSTTTYSFYNGEIDREELATTLATSLTSALSDGARADTIHAEVAREYVSSMSEEEIDDLLLKIEEKEFELTHNDNYENIKVKKLVPNNQKNNK